MSIQPSDAERRELYRDNPLILLAEQALRAFYVTTRGEAARLLPMWRHSGELTERERAAVLSRFDETRHAVADLPAGREDPETGAALPSTVHGYRLGREGGAR